MIHNLSSKIPQTLFRLEKKGIQSLSAAGYKRFRKFYTFTHEINVCSNAYRYKETSDVCQLLRTQLFIDLKMLLSNFTNFMLC